MESPRIHGTGPHTHEARAARGAKAGAAPADAAAAPGDGFALLLAALGGQDPALAEALPLAADAGDPGLAAAPDAATLAALLGGPGAAGLPQELPQTPASLAQAAGLLPGLPAAVAERIGLGLVRPGQDTLVGETALIDGAGEAAALASAAPATAGRAALVRGMRAGAASAALGDDLAPGRSAAAARAAAATLPGTAAAPAEAQGSALAATAAPPAAAAPERRDPLQAVAALGRLLGDPAGAPAAAGGAGPGLAGASPSGAPAAAGRGGDGAASYASAPPEAPGAPSALEGAAPADGAAQPGAGDPEAQLAERVAYWVHQQTQSAALTLDRDGQAVQVQVALTGDQAHVTFRSDEAQARQALDAGAAELGALLQAEGLQLAGMTVSAGGAGSGREGGAAQPGGRGAARQGVVRVQGAGAPAQAPGRTGAAAPGAVDVFV